MKAKKVLKDPSELKINIDEPVYTTGVVCRLLDIPIWILKQLDREGLVRPKRKVDRQARLYSHSELTVVSHCWYYMKEHKVNVHGLKVILKMEQSDS